MQPIFTMQYGEFAVADYLSKQPQLKGASVFIPASAQEKGIDLLLYKHDKAEQKPSVVTVQVKMSRTYMGYKTKTGLPFSLWFNKYEVQENADWFILVGIYAQQPDSTKKNEEPNKVWQTVKLAFTNAEMKTFMGELQQKRDPKKPDIMFGFEFEPETKEGPAKIVQSRGYAELRDMSKYLIENRLDEIAQSFR